MTTIPFGKFSGRTLDEINDPLYLRWMLSAADKDSGSRLGRFVGEHRDAIQDAIGAMYAAIPRASLTDSQEAACDAIESQLLDHLSPVNLHRLDGGAGYGKSYTVNEICRRALLAGYEVNACATSYVATQVLTQQLANTGVTVRTLASLCRLNKLEQEDREWYEVTRDTQDQMAHLLKRGKLLVVDEWSMVGDDVASRLMDLAASRGGKLLAVGDAYQLPPVGQRTPSAFSRIVDVVELTEPMRFSKGSDLYALEQLTRYQPRSIYDTTWDGSHEVRQHDTTAALIRQFVADYRAHPSEDGRVMLYRRADVVTANDAIREQLHGPVSRTQPLIDDERIMVMRTTDVGKDSLTGDPGIRHYSGTTFLVDHVEPATCTTYGGDIPCYRVHLSGAAAPVSVQLPGREARGAGEYSAALATLRDEAKASGDWRRYRATRDAILPVGYNYAMTVHRCQGQTVDRAYFDPRRLQSPDGAALTYVAATRARKNVHVVR